MKGKLIKVAREKMNVVRREEHHGDDAGKDKGRNKELLDHVQSVINRKKNGAVFVMVDTGDDEGKQTYACYMTANNVNASRFRQAFDTALPKSAPEFGGGIEVTDVNSMEDLLEKIKGMQR